MKKSLLVFAALLVCLAFVPLPACADSAASLARQIDGWNSRGRGTGNLSAAVSGNTVTVKGDVEGATFPLKLNISTGVTVVWQANLTGSLREESTEIGLIEVTGGGVFEVASGKIELAGPGGFNVVAAIRSHNDNNEDIGTVIVSGGTVSCRRARYAINSRGGRSIKISGGSVNATGNAIAGGSITISGGSIEGNMAIIGSNIAISGGTVSSLGERTISVADSKGARPGHVTVSGGVVESKSKDGTTIFVRSGTVTVNGGTVEAKGDGGTAISAQNGVTISGGIVSATSGKAILGPPPVTISGGLMFAYGSKISALTYYDNDAVIHIPKGRDSKQQAILNKPTDDGVIVAWDSAKGTRTYTAGTTTDLTVEPVGAAVWGKDGNNGGIRYGDRFFIISGVTVDIPEDEEAERRRPRAE